MLNKIKSKPFLCGVLIALFSLVVSILNITSIFITLSWSEIVSIYGAQASDIIFSILIQSFWVFIITFICYLVGFKLKSKIIKIEVSKLKEVISSKKNIVLFLCFCVLIPVVIRILDFYYFPSELSNVVAINFIIYDGILSALYNGVVEELWFRFGLTTLVLFTFVKVFDRKNEVHSRVYSIVAAIFTSLFLFSFQLSSVTASYGVNFDIFVLLRAIVLYLIMNLFYNYIYLKYGVKYSIICHIIFSFMFMLVIPLVIGLVVL